MYLDNFTSMYTLYSNIFHHHITYTMYCHKPLQAQKGNHHKMFDATKLHSLGKNWSSTTHFRCKLLHAKQGADESCRCRSVAQVPSPVGLFQGPLPKSPTTSASRTLAIHVLVHTRCWAVPWACGTSSSLLATCQLPCVPTKQHLPQGNQHDYNMIDWAIHYRIPMNIKHWSAVAIHHHCEQKLSKRECFAVLPMGAIWVKQRNTKYIKLYQIVTKHDFLDCTGLFVKDRHILLKHLVVHQFASTWVDLLLLHLLDQCIHIVSVKVSRVKDPGGVEVQHKVRNLGEMPRLQLMDLLKRYQKVGPCETKAVTHVLCCFHVFSYGLQV